MSAFTPEQQAEIGRLIELREVDGTHARLIRQLQGQTGRLKGPFSVLTLGLAAGSEATATYTHNLNLTGSQVIVGNIRDGSYSGRCIWRAVANPNSTDIVFYNADPSHPANAFLDFYIITG